MSRHSKFLVLLLAVAGVFIVGQSSLVRDFEVPVSQYEFRVEINGVDAGRFESVGGLRIQQNVIAHEEEHSPFIMKSAGQVSYGDIVLKRGYLIGTKLNDWIEASQARDSESGSMNVSIILIDKTPPWDDGVEIRRWNCYGCVPRLWRLSPLNNNSSKALTEEMVIAIEWFEEVEPGNYVSR